MSNKIIFTDFFSKKAKPLIKRFHTLKQEILDLAEDLIENPFLGDDLGNGIRKISLASKSKGKGKSGGFRVVTYNLVEVEDETSLEIHLILIYDKSEISDISKKDLLEIIKYLQ